jgi:hypothetical protein
VSRGYGYGPLSLAWIRIIMDNENLEEVYIHIERDGEICKYIRVASLGASEPSHIQQIYGVANEI